MRGLSGLVVAALMLPTFAYAQDDIFADMYECDWRARAEAIPEPWSEYSKTFANGEVRISYLDLIEPAAKSIYIMVLSPPYSELGDRTCRLIGYSGDGFSLGDFSSLTATYDASEGLKFRVKVGVPNRDATETRDAVLGFGLDQRLGAYDPMLEVIE